MTATTATCLLATLPGNTDSTILIFCSTVRLQMKICNLKKAYYFILSERLCGQKNPCYRDCPPPSLPLPHPTAYLIKSRLFFKNIMISPAIYGKFENWQKQISYLRIFMTHTYFLQFFRSSRSEDIRILENAAFSVLCRGD